MKDSFVRRGQPYIIHPLAVAYILLELGMDTDTICAAMLHDVVEDTPVTLDEVKNDSVRMLLCWLTVLQKLNQVPIFNKEEQQAEKCKKNASCHVSGYKSYYY